MDAKALVEKYIIIKVEQNGRVGVKPTNGKPTAREIEYLKTHKDEVFAAIEARETEYARWQAVVNAEAAIRHQYSTMSSKRGGSFCSTMLTRIWSPWRSYAGSARKSVAAMA